MKKNPIIRTMAVLFALMLTVGTVFANPSSTYAASKKPTKITLSTKKATMTPGSSMTIKVKSIKPSKASKKASTFTYKSSKKSVATVSKSGKITAKKTGKATITVTSKTAKKVKATVKVTVTKKVSKITAYKGSKKVKSITLDLSSKKAKTATVTAKTTPSSTVNKGFSFKSSKKSVATVSSKGKITAKKPGTTTITITSKDSKKKTAKVKVTVKASATKVTLSGTKTSMTVGDKATFKATVSPKNSTDKVKWTSSNTKVMTVGSNGAVVAKAAGTAKITAKAGKKSASVTVTVKAKSITPPTPTVVDVTGVTVNPTTATIKANETLTITAAVAPANATNKTLTWTSSNTAVATVSNGVVTPVSAGTATITAKSNNGKTATCAVTVVAEENAMTESDNSYTYTLDKNAESYQIKRNGKAYSVSKAQAADDVAALAQKTNKAWTTEMLYNYLVNTISASLSDTFKSFSAMTDAITVTSDSIVDTTELGEVDATDWWTAHSDGIEVTNGGIEITFNTKSYDTATLNWNTPIFVAYTGDEAVVNGADYAEYFVGRSDAYGWAPGDKNTANTPEMKTAQVGYPEDWSAFLASNKAGTTGKIVANIAGNNAVVKFYNGDAYTEYTFPVDPTKPVYISVSGELCKVTDIVATQTTLVGGTHKTIVIKDGDKTINMEADIVDLGDSIDICVTGDKNFTISDLKVAAETAAATKHELTFTVEAKGMTEEFKLEITKDGKSIKLINAGTTVVNADLDAYTLTIEKFFYNKAVEKLGMEDLIKATEVMNNYQK